MGGPVLDCGGKSLDLTGPRVMGVLNVTPDSFSDGGRFLRPREATARALRMVEEGAAVIDIGGESTRPGAESVPAHQELRRILPVIEALAPRLPVPISVDTSKPEVMRAVAAAGAGMINDVTALSGAGALEAAAELALPVCLMHMQGGPRTMQHDPRYDDVVAEVRTFLAARAAACEAVGIPRERLLLDPGFGFGKSVEHNATLLARLDRIVALGLPVLVGLSRKSFIGRVLARELDDRLPGSLAAAVLAVVRGARLIRAHDVAETADAVRMAECVLSRSSPDAGAEQPGGTGNG